MSQNTRICMTEGKQPLTKISGAFKKHCSFYFQDFDSVRTFFTSQVFSTANQWLNVQKDKCKRIHPDCNVSNCIFLFDCFGWVITYAYNRLNDVPNAFQRRICCLPKQVPQVMCWKLGVGNTWIQHWNSPVEKCDCFEVRIPPQIGSKPSFGSWHTPVLFWPKLTMQACRKCISSVAWAAKTEKTFKKLWIIFTHCQFCILKNAKFSVTQNLESVDNELWRMQKSSWHGKCGICQSHTLTHWHLIDLAEIDQHLATLSTSKLSIARITTDKLQSVLEMAVLYYQQTIPNNIFQLPWPSYRNTENTILLNTNKRSANHSSWRSWLSMCFHCTFSLSFVEMLIIQQMICTIRYLQYRLQENSLLLGHNTQIIVIIITIIILSQPFPL